MEVTLAHHVEKAGDNTSDVDCVTYHAIVLDSVLCQSPRHLFSGPMPLNQTCNAKGFK